MRCPRRCRIALLVAATLLVGACSANRNVQQIGTLESEVGRPRILLMPPDIRYYLVTAGGVSEPHAAWTEAARRNFSNAVQELARENGTDLSVLADDDMRPVEISYSKLHEAVGMMVMAHHFGSAKLPAKQDTFDWTLGAGVRELAEEHDADYALFVYYRDDQASGGRIATAVVAAAIGGYVDTGGGEHGFASLVDLRTGDIVWFSIVGAGSGELRDEAGARAAVDTLFRDLPAGQAP